MDEVFIITATLTFGKSSFTGIETQGVDLQDTDPMLK